MNQYVAATAARINSGRVTVRAQGNPYFIRISGNGYYVDCWPIFNDGFETGDISRW